MDRFDCVVIGGGPAGLTAALNLVRARVRVLVVDEGRPRNAATLRSHGFPTQDGAPPNVIRKRIATELAAYPEAEQWERARVENLARRSDGGFQVDVSRRQEVRSVAADTIVLAMGVKERLPAIPDLISYYGISVFSCIACDAYELFDRPLALFGDGAELADRALLLSRVADRLTVCTNGSSAIDGAQEARLRTRGVRVDRRAIRSLDGEKGEIRSVTFGDAVLEVTGGFVLPHWSLDLVFASELALETDANGFVAADTDGRSSVAGVYAAGDVTGPAPKQLVVAAGAGARAAAVLTHDLLGLATAH